MSDTEIDALAEEACPCMTDPDDPPSTKCMTPEYQQHWPECHASNRPAVSAAIRKALAANDAEWRGRVEKATPRAMLMIVADTPEEAQIADALQEMWLKGIEALRLALLEGR